MWASSASSTWRPWSRNNILAETHIRYGGYGGIAMRHVSDTYIALFSHAREPPTTAPAPASRPRHLHIRWFLGRYYGDPVLGIERGLQGHPSMSCSSRRWMKARSAAAGSSCRAVR